MNKRICYLFLLLSFKLWAHPVAYEDAYSFMSINNAQTSENTLVYSPRYWLGVGVKHMQSSDREWSNIHIGYLVKRWNEFDSQGNIYLFGGPGQYKLKLDQDSKNYSFFRSGLQADWESREIYTMFKYNRADSEIDKTEELQARFGFAPFIAGFNDLNVWAILQLDYEKVRGKELIITPIMRMFYKNTLWEIGSSLNNRWTLNFMVRY